MPLFFVDVEAYGAVPALGKMTEFGIVTTKSIDFHGVLIKTMPDPNNPAVPIPIPGVQNLPSEKTIAEQADAFIRQHSAGQRAVMISDNPAFDFMWMADFFWRNLGYNPFGHSARRIGDYYAGLVRNFDAATKWKKLRVTKHDHNPVNDARGNLEAFQRILKGER